MSDARYRRRRDVVWRHGVDRVFVLPVDGEEVTVLEGTAVAVWEALAEPTTAHALSRRLAERFSADATTVADDVGPTLTHLAERALVEELPGEVGS